MKKHILIAGVNGAGKSTLYHILDELQDMPRINTDEIVNSFGRWDNPSDVMKAGKVAVQNIKNFFDNGISFNQETTLCGKSILNTIYKAKQAGYFIEIHYVGVNSVKVAKARVKHRVSEGGHGIPDKDIERRYHESFSSLKSILNLCDQITFYDNSIYFERIAVYKNGQLQRISKHKTQWFENLIS